METSQKRRPWLRLGVLSAMTLLSGCAAVDRFGGRVVEFNTQMQQTRERLILNNILRAGFDEPLQFSEVSTISGQGSAQGSIGTVLPLLGPAGTSGTRLFQINPGFQMSGGPQVGVANTTTQEFFNGITAPLTMDQVATYVSNGKSRLAILMLTVAAIDFDMDGKHYHFAATPGNLSDFRELQSVLISLASARLAFERKESITYVGPPLTGADVTGKSVVQDMMRAPADAKLPALKRFNRAEASDKPAWDALSPAELKGLGNATEFYRLVSTETKTRLCFAPKSTATFGYVIDPSQPVPAEDTRTSIGKVDGKDMEISWGPDSLCSGQGKPGPTGIRKLTFTFRSVRGIFELLGGMARDELKAKDAGLFDIPEAEGMTRLFGIEQVNASDDGPWTSSNVRITSADKDRSGVTIQLLSEFVALNSSAKSFPTPSVIPFFTP